MQKKIILFIFFLFLFISAAAGQEYEVEAFTTDGTFSVPSYVDKVDVLVVGGGGGAADHHGGGGGAGGLVYKSDYSVSPGSNINVDVGAGGGVPPRSLGTGTKGGTCSRPLDSDTQFNGEESVFGSLTALGGGAGAGDDYCGRRGGSGGGGSDWDDAKGGHGVQSSSTSGGYGHDGAYGVGDGGGGGGGGGAGEAGTDNGNNGGDGGEGRYYGDIFGEEYGENGWFAGGGGGAKKNSGDSDGTGGKGGGGDGSYTGGNPGMDNTGGGGGGTDSGSGTSGGSGIVLVRYPANEPPNNPNEPSPSDGADPVELSPTLNVDVSDPNGDNMDVTFHVDTDNDGNHEYTDTDFGVGSGGTASTSLSSLSESQVVDWYVVADDGSATTTSSEWSFTTVGRPDNPSNPSPSDGSVEVSRSDNLEVYVDHPDGEDMTVEFDMDGNSVGSDTVSGSGTASVNPSLGYSEDHSWSVDVYTQGYSTSSSGGTWSFETVHNVDVSSISGPSRSPAPLDPQLEASVSHSDPNEELVVEFVDTDSGDVICSQSGVSDSETVTCDTSDDSSFGSDTGTTYNWEVRVSGDRPSESDSSSVQSFTTVSKPDSPSLNAPSPSGTASVSKSQKLKVDVSHPDGELMNVDFYIDEGQTGSFTNFDTVTGVGDGTVSANPDLVYGESYDWYVDVRTDGYDPHSENDGSPWSFTTNYAPTVESITVYDASDDHAFRNVSAIVSDQDGDDDITSAGLAVTNTRQLLEYNHLDIDRSYGNDNKANITFGRINYDDSGLWGHQDNMELTVQAEDSEGNTGSSTVIRKFPDHAPTTDSNFSYSDDPQAHAFTLNVDAQDVDNGDTEVDSCTVEHRDGEGNSYTSSGSLASGQVATCSFTIDDSYSGYDKGDSIEHRVTFEDLHGKTVTTSWASHTIPNTPPSATDLRPDGDNVTYEPVLNATYNDPDGDNGSLRFYNTSSGEEFGSVTNLAPGDHGTVDLLGELSPGTTYNFTVEASDGLNATNATENFTTIYRPDEPYDPFPGNDSLVDTTSRSGDEIAASVEVVQDDGHTMDVQFVNASDDSNLGIDFDVGSGDRAKLTNIDTSLRDETNTTYSWYAVAEDQVTGERVKSDTFEFRTVEVGNATFDVRQGEDGDNMDITGDSNNGWSQIEFEVSSTVVDPIPKVSVNKSSTGDAVRTWDNVDNNSVLTVDLEQDGDQDWDMDVDSQYEYFIEATEGPNILNTNVNNSNTIYTYNVSLEWVRAERYYDVYQYDVYRGEKSSGEDLTFNYGSGNYDLVGSLPETNFNDSGPGLGPETFCWKVAASNPSGSSDAIPLGDGECRDLS